MNKFKSTVVFVDDYDIDFLSDIFKTNLSDRKSLIRISGTESVMKNYIIMDLCAILKIN